MAVAADDAEICVDVSLVEISKFGHKAEFFFRLCAQGLVKILKFVCFCDVLAWSRF